MVPCTTIPSHFWISIWDGNASGAYILKTWFTNWSRQSLSGIICLVHKLLSKGVSHDYSFSLVSQFTTEYRGCIISKCLRKVTSNSRHLLVDESSTTTHPIDELTMQTEHSAHQILKPVIKQLFNGECIIDIFCNISFSDFSLLSRRLITWPQRSREGAHSVSARRIHTNTPLTFRPEDDYDDEA